MGMGLKGIGELERLVQERAHHKVKDLRLEWADGRFIMSGFVDSYHVKQLAQHGILDVMPKVRVVNSLTVRN
jgi:hypothetical protein